MNKRKIRKGEEKIYAKLDAARAKVQGTVDPIPQSPSPKPTTSIGLGGPIHKGTCILKKKQQQPDNAHRIEGSYTYNYVYIKQKTTAITKYISTLT